MVDLARGRGLLAMMASAALLGACAGGEHRLTPGQNAGDLDELLAFKNPAECEPGKPLKTLYDTMAAYDAAFQPQPRRPDLPARFAGAAGEPVVISREPDHAVISMALKGQWKGLPVQAVEGIYGIESDAFGLAIVFNAPLERAKAALQKNGFANSTAEPGDVELGDVGLTEDSAFGRASVTGDERTSRLVCDWGL